MDVGVVTGFIVARSLKGRLSISTIGIMDIFLAETLLAGFCSSMKSERIPKEITLNDLTDKILKKAHVKSIEKINMEVYKLIENDPTALTLFHSYFQSHPKKYSKINDVMQVSLEFLFKVKDLPKIKGIKSE